MKKVWSIGRIFYVLLIMFAVLSAAIYFAPKYAFSISLAVLGLGLIVVVLSLLGLHKNIGKIIAGVSKGLSKAQSKALSELKIPVLITTELGEIVWYNPAFESGVPDASAMVGKDMESVFGSAFMNDIRSTSSAEIHFEDHIFS